MPTLPLVRDTSPLAFAVHKAFVTAVGNLADDNVPDEILLAFVVSILAEFARPEICAIDTLIFAQLHKLVGDEKYSV